MYDCVLQYFILVYSDSAGLSPVVLESRPIERFPDIICIYEVWRQNAFHVSTPAAPHRALVYCLVSHAKAKCHPIGLLGTVKTKQRVSAVLGTQTLPDLCGVRTVRALSVVGIRRWTGLQWYYYSTTRGITEYCFLSSTARLIH